MNVPEILLRETLISMVINGALSLLFFLIMFDFRGVVPLNLLGLDFLPQSFMVSLMGSLVPGLLISKRYGGAARPVIRRALLFALAGLICAGGGALVLCASIGGVATGLTALTIKIAFGVALAAIVTPVAVRAALSQSEKYRS